ncbi:glycerate kinase [Marinobacterium sp. D7]|uniref:glycerate kinase family protein n=1 Tax=Marinobacterium ramblicola TaxID=2849041 RepID=UPI001C2DD0E1|nr:glycerate kinase [Marinobacterium ramblicola]MBV1790224.1 glycerate kinase [Marinobacterium ramblicola]
MKVVIAPDSFKESLSAERVARALADGWRSVMPEAELVELPLADGGEGTTQALVAATGGEMVRCRATGPLGAPVEAVWGRIDATRAVIECAAASGLDLVPRDARDPWRATTRGTGELILAALDSGARHIIVGLGGSATNDGGAGMLQALGVSLLDARGAAIGPGAAGLAQLAHIDISTMDPRLAEARFEVACDVDNPLTGAEGASAIFGPQKGADEVLVARMDAALSNYAELIQRCLGLSVASIPGAGAAGGLGAAFLAFLDAELKPGIEIILDAVEFDWHLQGADLLITGEGRIDGQTARGKTPVGVARRAMRCRVPCVALGGSVPTELAVLDRLAQEGIRAVFPILPGVSTLEEALADAERNLELSGRNLAAYWCCSQP